MRICPVSLRYKIHYLDMRGSSRPIDRLRCRTFRASNPDYDAQPSFPPRTRSLPHCSELATLEKIVLALVPIN